MNSMYIFFILGALVIAIVALYTRSRIHVSVSPWLEHYRGVADIDFKVWHEKYGITTVLFDVEGTLTEWADPQLAHVVEAALKKAKMAGIAHFGLVSNMSQRHVERLETVAKQIGAETYHVPTSSRERKPDAFMINAALNSLNVSPKECAFVGDKIVDVMAGKRAGVSKVAWVDRLGTADHPFDVFIYRHLEHLLKWFTRGGHSH